METDKPKDSTFSSRSLGENVNVREGEGSGNSLDQLEQVSEAITSLRHRAREFGLGITGEPRKVSVPKSV